MPKTLKQLVLEQLQQIGADGLISYSHHCQCTIAHLMDCRAPSPYCQIAALYSGRAKCPECGELLIDQEELETQDGESLQYGVVTLLLPLDDPSLDCVECDTNVKFKRIKTKPE